MPRRRANRRIRYVLVAPRWTMIVTTLEEAVASAVYFQETYPGYDLLR